MKRRCPESLAVGIALLRDYLLTFPRFYEEWEWGGVASVEPCVGAKGVWGVVYAISDEDLKKLDEFEHIEQGHYTRGLVKVEMKDGIEKEAITYFAIANIEVPIGPSKLYMRTIIKGADTHGLPAEYIEELRRIETNNGPNEGCEDS